MEYTITKTIDITYRKCDDCSSAMSHPKRCDGCKKDVCSQCAEYLDIDPFSNLPCDYPFICCKSCKTELDKLQPKLNILFVEFEKKIEEIEYE